MEKNENPATPGSPDSARASASAPVPGAAPRSLLGPSPLIEQKLPTAAFSNQPVFKKEKKLMSEEYCEDHPYDQRKTTSQAYSFHCKIKNYDIQLEE